jgi:ADP-heptose:LPS heptosyltransferase
MTVNPIDMSAVKRILIIKMSALGDIAKSVPTVDAIRATFPSVRIGWVVRQGLADLLVGNPSIDELFVAPRGVRAIRDTAGTLRRFRPDIVLDMQGLFISGCLGLLSGAGRRYTWESGRELSGLLAGHPIVPAPSDRNAVECLFGFARLLGVERMPEQPPQYLTGDPALIAVAEQMLADVGTPRIGMHIGASVANKTWPTGHWADLADRLVDAGFGVVLFGGKAEVEAGREVESKMRRRAVSLVGATTPRQLAAAISRCQLFLGGDTGATHIATLVGTPTVALMGATDPVSVGPYGAQHTVIYLGLPCAPCYRHPTCGGRFECMSGIDAARVFGVCQRKLHEVATHG